MTLLCHQLAGVPRNNKAVFTCLLGPTWVVKVNKWSSKGQSVAPSGGVHVNLHKSGFLISTYHPAGGFLNDIIRKNWDLLDRSSSTRPILNWKITKGFRRPKNLRDHLVRALCINPMDVQQDRRSNNLKKGKPKKRCSRPNCRYCPKLVKKGSINSPITGKNTTQSGIVIAKQTISFIVFLVLVAINNMLVIQNAPSERGCVSTLDLFLKIIIPTVWVDNLTQMTTVVYLM